MTTFTITSNPFVNPDNATAAKIGAIVLPSPASIRRQARQHQAASTHARWMRARRQAAARNGYRGPLTRDEATVNQLAALNAAGYR
jgi:hypothetical protein